MNWIKRLSEQIKKTVQDEQKKPHGADVQATVTRVEGDTAFVHIPGPVDETPVKLSISAKEGDVVQVRIAGGKAWLTGNITTPPTGDDEALKAKELARIAREKADEAEGIVGEAILYDEMMYLVTNISQGVTVDTPGWSNTPQAITESLPYLWTYHIFTANDGTVTNSDPVLTGVYGKDGTSVTILGSYETLAELIAEHPTGDLGDSYIISGDLYVWNGTAWENVGQIQGPEGPRGPQGIQGVQGPPGVSITGVTNYYLATSASSGVTRNTSGWTTTIQSMTATNQYLWNYEVTTGSDGSTVSTTDPVIIGRYGQNGSTGKGISSITEYYLATSASSGVTRNTSGWSTTVQATTDSKRYLWNYEKITYTSGDPSYTDARIIGTQGAQGIQGPKGDTGDTGLRGPQGDPGKTYVQLASGANLNSCLTKDYVYVTSSTAICESIVNGPSGKPNGELQLEIVWLGADTYLLQRLSCKNGAQRKVYTRTYSAGTFGAWTEEGVPYGTCTTAAGTAAKVAAINNYQLESSPYFTVIFSYANTASSPTLNVNSSGAKAIRTNGVNAAYWAAGAAVNFYYDGTYYNVASSPVYASEVTVGNPNGDNVYIGNSAFQVRQGSNVYTQVDSSGMIAQNGASNKKFFQAGTGGLIVYNGGTTQVAVLGYGSGTDSSGSTANAPYFNLGTRSGSIGNWSAVFGSGTASSYMTFIQGYSNTASNLYAMASGYGSTASGLRSFARGYNCTASGSNAIAMGNNSTSTSSDSVAIGYYCNATANDAKAIGNYCDASYSSLFATGKYNSPTSGDLFEVGDGSSSSRRNAFRATSSGTVYARTGYYVEGHTSAIGDYKVSEVSTRATPASGAEDSTGCSVSLGAGSWVVGYIVSFVAGSGTRTCALYNGSTYIDYSRTRLAVASTGYTILNNTMIINLASAATINLYAGHAGVSSSQTYNASLRAVRIA